MLKRHEVEILLKTGHRKTEVAQLTGVSLCSVKRIAQEGPVVHVDDAACRRGCCTPTENCTRKCLCLLSCITPEMPRSGRKCR
jgi:hypothetical protein